MLDVNIDVEKVFQERLASSMGLDKYQYIMEHVYEIDVSVNEEFQRIFNGFYIIRRNEEWRKIYYEYFEKVKKETPTFENILLYLYEQTGNVEPSFSSKMLASLFPEKPIWDRYIVQNLGIQLNGTTKQEKMENAIKLYDEIEQWYDDFLKTDKAAECIEVFDRVLSDYKWLSNIKKIDCILWSVR